MPMPYLAPGVYVETLPTGPAPIRSVATAVLGLIAPKASEKPKALEPPSQAAGTPNQPTAEKESKTDRLVLLQSWDAFKRQFENVDSSTYFWPRAVKGYFENGGRNIHIIEIPFPPDRNAIQDTIVDGALNELKTHEDVTLLAFPDSVTIEEGVALKIQRKMIEHCAQMKDRIALLDLPFDWDPGKVEEWVKNIRDPNPTNPDAKNWDPNDPYASYGAVYYPWLQYKPINGGERGKDSYVPPSGHIAGVIARVDSERGVHKAAANELIRGIIGLRPTVTQEDQAKLNPIGANCIRVFPEGINVWGARTLVDINNAANEPWRYINVRRLVCNITDSILAGVRWAVFEPNGPVLWAALRRDVTAYLRGKWQEGALVGRTPDQAFFVKCDESNNPPESVKDGKCQIDIGIAPVRPAEFVVFRIGQWDGSARITNLSE